MTGAEKNTELNTLSFLNHVLPDSGYYCLAEFFSNGAPKHHFFEDTQSAAVAVEQINARSPAVYHACASYTTPENRKQANVASVKSFFLDLDVGETKEYATREDAKQAITSLCQTLQLHVPTIIMSGRGLHCYFVFDLAVSGDVWRTGALLFRQVLDSIGFKHDPSRTTDQASILRPVGSTWRKEGEQQVRAVHVSEPKPFGFYMEKFNAYARANNLAPAIPTPSKAMMGMFAVEQLGIKKHFVVYEDTTENREKLLSAAKAAYPEGIPQRHQYMELGLSLATLVVIHHWPESAARDILEEIASKPELANRENNDSEWANYVRSTREKHNQGEELRGIGSIFDKAKENGWFWGFVSEIPEWVTEFNKSAFVAPFANTVSIYIKKNDRFIPIDKTAFNLLYGNKLLAGKSIGTEWLKHPSRREYAGVEFKPNALVEANIFNLWQEWAVPPFMGDVKPALDHIFYVICSGNEENFSYLMGWLANLIQNTARPGEVAVVLCGERGTGKTIFTSWFKTMFGAHALSVSNSKHLTGQFTGHLERIAYLVAEEAVWAGNKEQEGVLKHLITSERLLVEVKNHTPYEVNNYLHIIMTSNESWVVPAGYDERRFFVLNVNNEYRGNHAYFERLNVWAKNGGISALLSYLQNYDLSSFNLRKPPNTEGLRTQKILSLDIVDKWILERLEIGGLSSHEWRKDNPAKTMVTNLIDSQRLNSYEVRQIETRLGLAIPKIFKGAAKKRVRGANDTRQVIYFIPLNTIDEARAAFEIYAGFEGYDWGQTT